VRRLATLGDPGGNGVFPKSYSRLHHCGRRGLCALLAVGVWKARSRKRLKAEPEAPAGQQNAEMKLTDMEFTEMQEGRRYWTLLSSEARYFQDRQQSALKGGEDDLFPRKGRRDTPFEQ